MNFSFGRKGKSNGARAMAQLVAAALSVAVGLYSGASFAREINERFLTGPSARLSLSNISGEIQIAGWEGEEVVLSGELDPNAEMELSHEGNRVDVKVVKKKGARRMGGSDLFVKVPLGSELSVYAVSADLRVEEVAGPQRLEVVSGDIAVVGFVQDLQVTSVSGDIELAGTGQASRIAVVSVSGDTRVRDAAGEIEVTSVSGATRLSGGDFDRVNVKSTSGRVEFMGSLNSSGRFDAEVMSGNVVINLNDDAEIDVEVETFSGNINNCLGEQNTRKSKYKPGQLLQFSRGAANRDVRVRSMSGDVKICAR